ncbi:hypothetical protein NXZ77_18490 [Lysinibacillus boronitolerans]|uniref:hypothetical protein n=1 Tax=Lysinibacillus boronitolerans TaxID=309788 RepID=UPI002162BFCD|nr:hypothetical protein [Lysinibacillus boronitolerans]MCS1393562.1 hypothetical protein [Lysinibacillus boronitolerans]
MARMRVIGSSFDKGYRDDLNYNFGLLEALIGEANGLTDNLREEMLEKINNLQQQIDMLTGENIGELLERLNDSIQQALTAAQEARTAKTATEEATALATTATELANASALLAEEKANYANEKAVLAQEAADNANQEASNLSQLKIDVVQATQDANTATGNANQATQAAQTATDAINVVLPNVTGLVNLKEWSIETQYKKNNFVTLEGNGYMALRDNKGVKPPSFPVLSNADWAMFVQKGEKGEQGTGVRILGTLPDESSLPPIGEPGDAYLINGDLYVWSDTTNDWTNVGTIKGPKGDTGPQGPEGPQGLPGKDADLTEVNQEIANLQQTVTDNKTEVTEHLAQLEQTTENHINNNSKHVQTGERSSWNGKMNGGNGYSSGNNVNLITSSGIYATTGDGINLPTAGGDGWATFINLPPMPDNIERSVQLCYKWNDTTSGRSLYFRTVNNGNFSEWSRILHQTDYDKLFQSVSDGKAAVNQAVTDMGVYTAPDATFATTAANIRLIPKGRKEAKGVAYASNVSGRARIIVTGLSFHPTAILITKENNNNNEFKSIYAPSDVFFDNNSNAYMNFFTYNETGSILIASPALVGNYQGFEMNVSMTYNSRSEGAYRWFAFG